ncbi:unnamed protein product [Hydatigera taeniaeformis]|uniref:Lectin_legB domain-containing protein n=1 Tax=Hydatigena taeniaeformis TaxID=6205 RepID=A0A0R3X9D3_HYDTA|nr:unnamed protein product [Hydatigera taeniaeformis]
MEQISIQTSSLVGGFIGQAHLTNQRVKTLGVKATSLPCLIRGVKCAHDLYTSFLTSFMTVDGVSTLPSVHFLPLLDNVTYARLNITTVSPDLNGEAVAMSNQFSLWIIIVMSLTCLFTIAFILCGLFKRADAYHMPLTPEGEIDIANIEGLGLQGNEGMFGVSGTATGWI